MRFWSIILAIGLGGALGAVSRHLLAALFHGPIGLPEYASIMIVNVTGCFLIGFCYLMIEAVYRKDLSSPLHRSDLARPLIERGWWPEEDRTEPVVRSFRHDLTADILAGFLITGFLGGMTTFSLFSLLSYQLQQGGAHLALLFNAVGSVALGVAATYLGLHAARWVVLRRM